MALTPPAREEREQPAAAGPAAPRLAVAGLTGTEARASQVRTVRTVVVEYATPRANRDFEARRRGLAPPTWVRIRRRGE